MTVDQESDSLKREHAMMSMVKWGHATICK